MAAQAFAADWQLAVPGWRYEFPRDYFIHPDFKTEWWYFTGHLTDENGNRYGYELTFFRQGLRAPSTRNGETSRFLVNDLKFAHFAVTDLSTGQFHFQQKLNRGAFNEAGFAAFRAPSAGIRTPDPVAPSAGGDTGPTPPGSVAALSLPRRRDHGPVAEPPARSPVPIAASAGGDTGPTPPGAVPALSPPRRRKHGPAAEPPARTPIPIAATAGGDTGPTPPGAGSARRSPVLPVSLAWIDDWSLEWLGGESFALHAKGEATALDLHLSSGKPWVIHGEDGVSQKASGDGHASHYFSGTRLASEGQLSVGGKTMRVTGESWLDREWATNQLAPGQAGWNWFSIQLDDGTELMLYQMRKIDGSLDPNSSGTFIARDGAAQHLRRDEYQLVAESYWSSPATEGRYPIAWRLSIPGLGIVLRITTPLANQELVFNPIIYWEGLIDVDGVRSGVKVRGQGYMELTGYAGRLSPLSSGE
jgi:predicted secreted hydrolase